MKKKIKSFTAMISLALGMLLLAALISSCGGGGGGGGATGGSTEPTYAWQSVNDGGLTYVQFLTSDPNAYGYYFTNTFHSTNPMTTETVTVKKQSGSQTTGYGIVFCWQNHDNFYAVLIDTQGHYSVHRVVAGNHTVPIDWASSADLLTGLGAANTLSVVHNGGGNFTIHFNAGAAVSFSDGSFTGGSYGFLVAVSDPPDENLPGTPVDVRFRMTAPITVP